MRWDALINLAKKKQPTYGAEIGVQLGAMTRFVVPEIPSIKKYYAIDPFVFYDDFERACLDIPEIFRTEIGRNQKSMNEVYQQFLKRIEPIRDKVYVLKMFSNEASKVIDDNSLDFCFIDGNHLYEYVKQDIELYLPKVKKGGLIGGHDFGMPGTGVKDAVEECFNNNDIMLYDDWTWFVWKE